MKIEMIVTDLDGTLLRSDKTISAYTKEILSRCREMGIKIAYATGRGASANELLPAELFEGSVIMNGALAFCDNHIVYKRLIPYQTSRDLLLACDEFGMKITSERNGVHYSNFHVSGEWPAITNYKLTDFSKHERDAEKLYTPIESQEQATFIKDNLPDELYLSISRDGLAMIMHREAMKSKAINALAKYWEIPTSSIVAFGDDLNDLDLLQHCGVGIAIGNALDEAKNVADYTCDTNDHDGLAIWLDENLLD
jgi:Cof subfamily protein (haloacid dehalogenase superfamily)